MNKVLKFLDSTFLDLGRQFKWTYLPPLMVYVAAGISGLTGIVGTFFVKDYLNLSAAFLAGLGFWAGIPWALKMPCLLYTSPSPRDQRGSRMPSSA